jgi:hypothetical protein
LGCSEFASDTYPVTIVRVRRDDSPVSFSEGRSQGPSCR